MRRGARYPADARGKLPRADTIPDVRLWTEPAAALDTQ